MACSKSGINARTGRLKKGYRWAKGRKKCPIPARGAKGKGRRSGKAYASTRRISTMTTMFGRPSRR